MKLKQCLLIWLLPAITFAQANLTSAIKENAEACANALVSKDFDQVVRYTHPNVVKGMGGKEAMIRTLKMGMNQMSSQGISFHKVTIGSPETPVRVNGILLSKVSQRLYMQMPNGLLQVDSHLLGISEDDGSTWYFIDLGPITKAQLEQAFPSFGREVTLPPKTKPKFVEGT